MTPDDTSVRSTIQTIYFSSASAEVVDLPHVSVHRPRMEAMNPSLEILIRETLQAHVSSFNLGSKESHWLDVVPAPLRQREEDVVNYLGMVAAIDFRHWGEEQKPDGGIAADGEEVHGFVGFYCVAPTLLLSGADVKHAEHQHSGMISQNHATDESDSARESTHLVRGSAAMMFLLRRAVEVHHIPWYDPTYLCALRSEEEAWNALMPCFTGCKDDGVQPMLMPAMKERIVLLLSLAKALQDRQTDFYKLLLCSNGMLFSHVAADRMNSTAVATGFVDQLRSLHHRYDDVGHLQLSHEGGATTIPILKLSQLTAIGVIDALKAFWMRSDVVEPSQSSSAACTWLEKRRDAVQRGECGDGERCHVFLDEHRLSLCCDYQIPKALLACKILVYDEYLTDLIDRHVLLTPGSSEEVAIRVGTLVAGEMLLDFMNGHSASLFKQLSVDSRSIKISTETGYTITANALDYSLWFMGRTLQTTRHHLCRTIMY